MKNNNINLDFSTIDLGPETNQKTLIKTDYGYHSSKSRDISDLMPDPNDLREVEMFNLVYGVNSK